MERYPPEVVRRGERAAGVGGRFPTVLTSTVGPSTVLPSTVEKSLDRFDLDGRFPPF